MSQENYEFAHEVDPPPFTHTHTLTHIHKHAQTREYFCKNYGECKIIDYSSSFQGQHTRYVVVLQFDKGDVANRIKQK